MKKLFTLFSERAASKVVLLASLLIGMTACQDSLESEVGQQPKTLKAISTHGDDQPDSSDPFMKHISDLGSTTFYVGQYAKFNPVLSGDDISGVLYTDYGHNTKYAWYYGSNKPNNANRNMGVVTDSIARFDTDTNYVFCAIDYDTYNLWEIKNVPGNVYHETFEGMTHTELAQLAKDSLTAANADKDYTDGVYDFILSYGSYGLWETRGAGFNLLSKGKKIARLAYSDVGFKQGPAPVGKTNRYEASPYIGGDENKRMSAPSQPLKFAGTAFVSVMKTNDQAYYPNSHGASAGTGLEFFSTDVSTATYAYGVNADTLKMEFHGWYEIEIIRDYSAGATGQMKVSFPYYPSIATFPEKVWGVHWNQSGAVNTKLFKAPNGINFSVYDSESEGNYFNMAISEPLFYGKTSTDVTTGLNNVYAAPKRNAASSEPKLPREVVISGEYKEYLSGAGIEVNFVFGGGRIY